MSPEGKPIEVNASVLQAAASQNAVGMFYKSNTVIKCLTRYSNFCYRVDVIMILA